MTKKIFLVGSLVFACVFSFAALAKAVVHYTSGHSSVDAREIRWNGGLAYRDQLNAAIGTWNARRRINIAPDTAWTIEDLRISDLNAPQAVWTGRYTYRALGVDDLEINRGLLVNRNNNERQNTITHELGHALGLAHSTLGNVLYPFLTPQIALGPQDISDYVFLWGN